MHAQSPLFKNDDNNDIHVYNHIRTRKNNNTSNNNDGNNDNKPWTGRRSFDRTFLTLFRKHNACAR